MKTLLKGLLANFGYELKRIKKIPERIVDIDDSIKCRKINYACGNVCMEGWLNVDGFKRISDEVLLVDLADRHPFKADFFEWGFCEDFIEHLSQADSLIFLAEVYRTFKPGGVCRLSFPCLDGQIRHGPPFSNYDEATAVKEMYYTQWGHFHLYSKQEFELLCRHIGFSKVEFKEFGGSDHPELRSLEWRDHVEHYNAYVEITK